MRERLEGDEKKTAKQTWIVQVDRGVFSVGEEIEPSLFREKRSVRGKRRNGNGPAEKAARKSPQPSLTSAENREKRGHKLPQRRIEVMEGYLCYSEKKY